jgi:DNA-binding IclR family transcriptional regulator
MTDLLESAATGVPSRRVAPRAIRRRRMLSTVIKYVLLGIIAMFAALPFLFYAPEWTFTDAYFEAVSGLTASGATVLSGLDELPQARRSSVERVHRLLSSFDHEHTHLRLSDLSRRAGLPLSTTHRMVTELLELGMLERDQDNFLCIGVAMWKFGLLTPKTYGIQRVALPFMQDLYATTRLPVHLGIPQGYQATIVESLRPRGSGRERPRIGQRDPLHMTAVGTALLAYCDADFQESYLTNLKGHDGTATSEVIRRELAQTRASGCAISKRKTAPRIAIGAPVLLIIDDAHLLDDTSPWGIHDYDKSLAVADLIAEAVRSRLANRQRIGRRIGSKAP